VSVIVPVVHRVPIPLTLSVSSMITQLSCSNSPVVASYLATALSVAVAGHSTLSVLRLEKLVFITALLSFSSSDQFIVVIVDIVF
jgi:hypothetical protein